MAKAVLALVLVVAVVGAVLAGFRVRSARQMRTAADRSAAIRAVFDPTVAAGWVETFEADEEALLVDHDPRWQRLFGELVIDPHRQAAIGDEEGSWQRDKGDDYAYRVMEVPTGSVEIVMEGWWDGEGSIAVQGAVQAEPPHRLYEATLWRGRMGLIYFEGPAPTDFTYLAESTGPMVGRGFYRVVFRMERLDSMWHMHALLQDPAAGYRTLADVSASDSRLGEGGQGIGILGGGRSSYITGISVRAL